MTPPDGTIRYAMEVVAFHQAIREAWCLATSADPDAWTPDNPAWGQCAVTALLVQDVQGGDLLRSTVRGVSHYWNRLPDETILDLTLEQFGGDLPDAEPDLILEAVACTRWTWEPPELGLITFVDAGKVRHKRDPGRCYRKAGFQHVGFTKGGLWAFQLLPEAMPEPAMPLGAQTELVA